LARGKLNDINALIARAEQMKEVLEASLRCGCLTLDTCALVLSRQESGDAVAVSR